MEYLKTRSPLTSAPPSHVLQQTDLNNKYCWLLGKTSLFVAAMNFKIYFYILTINNQYIDYFRESVYLQAKK